MDLVAYFHQNFGARMADRHAPEYGYPSQLVDTWYGGEYWAPRTWDGEEPVIAGDPLLMRCGFRTRQDVLACLRRLGVYTPALLEKD